MLSRPDEKIDPRDQQDEFVRQCGIDFDLLRDCAKWACRGWTGADGFEAKPDTVKVDNREHIVLSDEDLRGLHANRLLAVVGIRSILWNIASEAEKKRLASPSPLPTPTLPTNAADAAATDAPKTTDSNK